MVWGTDDFNRAALGTDWNIGAGTWDIATSTNLRNTSGSGIIGHTPSQPTTQDQVIQFQMLGPNATTKILQLRCRMNATATHYFAMRVSNANISFRAAVGAGEVTIGSTYSFTRASGSTYRFEVEGTGSNILLRAYLDDVLVNSFTANNAVVGTSTCINPSGTGTNQLFDNYAGGDLSSKPGTAQQYQVSGTVPVVVGASGAATVVVAPVVHQVSGIAAVTTGASGNPTVVGAGPVQHQVSGSVAVMTVATGTITSRQQVSGTVAVTTGASGTLYTPSGHLTQETMPSIEEAWVLAPAPTYSMTASSTVTGTLVLPTDSRVKITGFASKGRLVAAATSGYWRGPYASDKGTAGTGTDPWILPTWGMKFKTNAPVVEFKMQQRPELPVTSAITTRMMVRVKVNGQWTSRKPVYLGYTDIGYAGFESPEYITIGDDFWLKLDFGSSADRVIELEMMTECGGVKIPSGYSMVAGATDPQHTIAWLGDSINGAERHGTGNFSLTSTEGASSRATYANLSSLAHYAGQSIGYDNNIIAAVGSTGFTRPGDSVAYEDTARIDNDVIALDPHVVVVGTAFNDLQAGTSTALVNSSCDFILQRLRAALPDAILVILACPTPPVLGNEAAGSSTVTPYNNALKTSAVDNGAWVIDPNTGDLYNPAGAVVYNGPNMVYGTAQGVAMIASDQQHPSQEGADYFGLYISDYLRLVHPVGVPVPKTVSGSVAVTTGVSGTVTQRHQVSGSVAVVTGASGDATRVPIVHQVSGSVAVTTGASGVISANFQVMQWVEVRRNIALNPVATDLLGGFSPNNVYWDRTFVTSVPAPHPQGITTAAMVQNNGGGSLNTVASLYNVDLLANTGPARYWGAWFYVDAPGYQVNNMLGYAVDLPADQWTWITFPQLAANQWSGFEIYQPLGGPAAGHTAWITGVTEFPATVPTESLWGDQVVSGARISWAGTPNASESIRQEPIVKTAVATGASGAVTVISGAVQHQVSGAVAVVTTAGGAATRVPMVHQVSGVVPVVTAAVGAVTPIGGSVQWQVSGTVAVITGQSGVIAQKHVISYVAWDYAALAGV